MGDVVVVMGEWRFIVTRRRVVRCHPHMSAFLVTLVDIVILLSSGPSNRAVVTLRRHPPLVWSVKPGCRP